MGCGTKRCCVHTLGRQWARATTAAVKTSVTKWISVLSNLIASIWTPQYVKCRRLFLELNTQVQKEKGKLVVRRSTSSIKRQIKRFHVEVVQWTSKKCTKKRDARAELLFWSLNLLFFWSRRCGRRRSCLSSLICTCIRINSLSLRLTPFWMVSISERLTMRSSGL